MGNKRLGKMERRQKLLRFWLRFDETQGTLLYLRGFFPDRLFGCRRGYTKRYDEAYYARKEEEMEACLNKARRQEAMHVGTDRFVFFKKSALDGKPTEAQITQVLKDFLGPAATKVWVENGVLIAQLPGPTSFPFKSMEPSIRMLDSPERYLEIHFGGPKDALSNIDIITRRADEFTNVLANGFEDLVIRYWEATSDKANR